MNYQEYRLFKENIDIDSFLRLDCMNPLISLKNLKEENPSHKKLLNPTRFSSVKKDFDTLKSIEHIRRLYPNLPVILPNGVYPRYLEISNSKIIQDNYLNIKNSIIVLALNFPNQKINKTLVLSLLNRNNIVIIDAVYDFNQEFEDFFINSKNLYILRSSTKLQLKKEIVIVFSNQNFIKEDIYWDYELEKKIKDLIIKKWKKVKSCVNYKIDPQGYFCLLDINFYELLQKKILGVPYSVFTNDPKDISKTMITCLHESI